MLHPLVRSFPALRPFHPSRCSRAPNRKVDLAYWSNFVEVRRDAASAFAALSMNGECVSVLASWLRVLIAPAVYRAYGNTEENLFMLAQAGALGALLSLIGTGKKVEDQDSECLRVRFRRFRSATPPAHQLRTPA